MMLRYTLLTVLCLLPLLASPAWGQPTQVLLIRHAERAAEPAGDPALTDAGRQRAQALAEALRDAGVTAIITTEFRRSAETAAALAQQLKLRPEVVAARGGDTASHVAAVAAAVRSQRGVVLVVGHSNTVPAIAAALGAPRLPDLCESSFSHLWVLTPQAELAPHLLRLRYGEADDAPAKAGAACQ